MKHIEVPAVLRCGFALCAAALITGSASSAWAALGLDERGFVDGFVAVPTELTTLLGEIMPERVPVSPAFLNESFDPNLHLVEDANVTVTFVHEGAGYKNALGYFTYRNTGSGVEIVDRQLIFPNASASGSGGVINPGDTVTLRDADGAVRLFPAGTNIGFFVVSSGWQATTRSVSGWDPAEPVLPSTVEVNAATALGVFTTIDQLNPEFLSSYQDRLRHFALVYIDGLAGFLDGEGFFLVGVEDQKRSSASDNDFNDVVFFVRSNPPEAIGTQSTIRYDSTTSDPDGDGVEGLADYYPDDPLRAFNLRTPSTGQRTLAFEDSYPNVGDQDYNDVIVQYAFEEVSGADNLIKDVSGTFHLIARGAGLDHAFGVDIASVPAGVSGQLRIERFGSDGTWEPPTTVDLKEIARPTADPARVNLAIVLFDSTLAALPSGSGSYSNTQAGSEQVAPASVRFVLTFDEPLERTELGLPPYDPFLSLDRSGSSVDIHGVGAKPFVGRLASLPEETGALSFMDDNGFPWLLHVPYDWRYPLEKVAISEAYTSFDGWRSSYGLSSVTWYESPRTSGAYVWAPLDDALRLRDWTLKAGYGL